MAPPAGYIPDDAGPHTDARTPPPDGTAPSRGLAAYVEAADALRAGRVNHLEFQGTVYRIARTRRLLRWGPDGPEGPRPSDVNGQDPARIHPALDEDGRVIPEECPERPTRPGSVLQDATPARTARRP